MFQYGIMHFDKEQAENHYDSNTLIGNENGLLGNLGF